MTCPLCGRTFTQSGHLARHRRLVRCDQTPPSFEERFWARVDQSGGPNACWPWLGATRLRGYGVVRDRNNGRNRVASQIAWEIAHDQPFPAGYEACHTCDNPPCCNPAHLFVGTKSDNVQDSILKGRAKYSGRTECKRGHPLMGPGRCQTCRTAHNRARYDPAVLA